MNHLKLIIQREYLSKLRNKAFIIMTFLSPMFMVALVSAIFYLTQMNKADVKVISVLDDTGVFANQLSSSESLKYILLNDMSLKDAQSLSKAQENLGLLYFPKEESIKSVAEHIKFYSESSPSVQLIADLENEVQSILTEENLKSQGYDLNKIERLRLNVNFNQETYSGEKNSKIDNIVKLIFGGGVGYLLFMFIIIYGNMIMRSVIEEKTSRVIEIIISSVKPFQLMFGKIIGTTLAGITQFVIWIFLGYVLITILSVFTGVTPTMVNSDAVSQGLNAVANQNNPATLIFESVLKLPLLNLAVTFILFFIGGYLTYSALYAAVGASVDNETDTQQFVFPILIPLILSVYVGFFTVIDDPHGQISTIFSFIPFTSPVVMLMRIPFGVPIWQQIVSLLILYVTFVFMVWVGAKVYRVGILMYGKKPTFKEIYKWLKY